MTLTLLRAIEHDPGEPVDEFVSMAADLINVVATIVDAEGEVTGDLASATLSISDALNFEDDEPSVVATDADAGELVTSDETLGTDTADFAGLFTNLFGADEEGDGGDVTYTLGITLGPTGIFDCATDEEVVLSYDPNTNIVSGTVTGGTVFTLSVDSTAP